MTAVAAREQLVAGRYRLGPRLGAGGFGTVYEAFDERLKRPVALKLIPADGPAPERARREALAAARLDNHAVVALMDAGQDGDCIYLVSELVRGRTMAQLSAEGALSDRDVLRIGLSLADALEHAHERGVVHRDVKPQNVLVPEDGGPAKLTDFGVASLAGDDPLTRTGDVVGTLAYMAPEQAAGQRVDEQADLYSMALVIYEGLAGYNPVRAASPAETARRVGTVLPGLGRTRRDLPPELVAAIDRALRPRPEERGTLAELADELEASLTDVDDEGGTVAPLPLERRIRGQTPRAARFGHGVLSGALAAAVLGPPWALLGLAPALFPRAGWAAASLTVITALFSAGRAGEATLIAAMLLPVPVLLRFSGATWSLPALTGLLPVVAGQARHWMDRLALGALGAWWLLLGEPLIGRAGLVGFEPDGPWRSGASLGLADVLAPVCASGAPVLCGLWAFGALVLPWIVRGRSLALDVVTASAWAATLGAGTAAVAEWIGRPQSALLVPAAVAWGAIAVLARHRPRIITSQ